MQENHLPLTQEQFFNWINEQPSNTIIGYPSIAMNCPLSNALKSITGVSHSVVPDSGINEGFARPYPEDANQPSPRLILQPWQNCFANNIDELGAGTPITPQIALDVFRKSISDPLS